jgi:hypothetical protein
MRSGFYAKSKMGEFIAREVWFIPSPTKEEIHDIQGYDA